jgi:hypothetical protein
MGPGTGMTRFESIDWYETPRYCDIVFDAGTAVECDFLESMKQCRCADLAAPLTAIADDRNRLSRGIAVTFLAISAREEW